MLPTSKKILLDRRYAESSVQYRGIETFCVPLRHILVGGYRNIVPPGGIETLCLLGVLKHFEHKKVYKDLELYQVFMYNFLCWIDLNIFKHFDQKILQENSYTIFVPKCFNTPTLYTIDAHFYNPSQKIGFISFSSSSDTQKFHHLLGWHATGINSSFNSFLSDFRFSD